MFCKTPRFAAPQRRGVLSGTLLVIHLCAGAFCVAAAWLFFQLGLTFPACGFYEATGWCCISCGATRAVGALLNLRILRSLLFNPLPIMLGALWLTAVSCEIYSVLRKKTVRLRGAHWYILGIVLVALAYCVLRNAGVFPLPAQVGA